MKLEVGMYVRFKTLSNEVKISQIKEIENKIYILDNKEATTDKFIIGKPSFNIIDLIEVGDYVNGLPVTKTSEYFSTHEKYIELYGTCSNWENEDIKSIVTKEQFENAKYRIGDE